MRLKEMSTLMPMQNEPASKADLHELEERLLRRDDALEERLLKRDDELEERLLKRLEKVETNLLNAFRTWARRSDTRQKATSILVNSFDDRLGEVEDEVADIRDKLKT